MTWTFTLQLKDVNGAPISGAKLKRSTWNGQGNVHVEQPDLIGVSATFTVAAATINVICTFEHPDFAPLTLNLVRSASELTWRWTTPAQQVHTLGRTVEMAVVLGRIRAAPVQYIPEKELQDRATKAKAPIDANHKQRHPDQKLPDYARVENLRAVLVTKDYTARFPTQERLSDFHLAKAELLGDQHKTNWDRFASTKHTPNLAQQSKLYLVEYGAVGVSSSPAPRFLLAVWVPNACAKIGVKNMDFVVWLHPNTRPDSFPEDHYPFRGDYPYALWAYTEGTTYQAVQRYVNLPLHHLYSQQFLAYQMAAAAKAAVIVIPVIPTSNYTLFESGATLMRLLKELCLWIPRLDQGLPQIFPPPPRVRRVVISGFSAAVPHIGTLLRQIRTTPDPHYQTAVWLSPAAEFDSAWQEIWAIDGYFERDLAKFSTFVQQAIGWMNLSSGRRLCIYKNDFSDAARWDPRAEPALQRLLRGVTPVERGQPKDPIWAISIADPSGRWHVASFSVHYVLGTAGATDVPQLNHKLLREAHQMMPRIMFGHAAVTSKLAQLT